MPHQYQSVKTLGSEDHVQAGAEEGIDPVLHPVFNSDGLPLVRRDGKVDQAGRVGGRS